MALTTSVTDGQIRQVDDLTLEIWSGTVGSTSAAGTLTTQVITNVVAVQAPWPYTVSGTTITFSGTAINGNYNIFVYGQGR